MDRIIALVDMDCFYVQVEQRANPELKGKPCAVVQYNSWKGGGIIAVSYEARDKGVTRQMRGDDARQKCPDIKLVQVPEVRGKADLTKYREAGAEVIAVFMTFTDNVERASVDEAYIDLTSLVAERMKNGVANVEAEQLPNTFIIGYRTDENKTDKENGADVNLRQASVRSWLSHFSDMVEDDLDEEAQYHERRLAIGAAIVEEMRAAVYEHTGFRCSAGIAHNKVLAKTAAGIHKPKGQSILPHPSVNDLFTRMPIKKVRHFGGKFGDTVVEDLKVKMMSELCQFSEKFLVTKYGEKSGSFVYEMCRGLEHEPVNVRQFAKSVGCSKNFRGREMLDTKEKVKFWLAQLSEEVEERLNKDKEANKRVAKHLTVYLSSKESRGSRSCGISRYDAQKFAEDAYVLLSKFNNAPPTEPLWYPSVINLSVMAGKFAPIDNSVSSMKSFLTQSSDKSVAFTQTQTPKSQQLSKLDKSLNKSSKGSIQGLFIKLSAAQEQGVNGHKSPVQGQKTEAASSTVHHSSAVASTSKGDKPTLSVLHNADQAECSKQKKPSFFESFMRKRKADLSDCDSDNSVVNVNPITITGGDSVCYSSEDSNSIAEFPERFAPIETSDNHNETDSNVFTDVPVNNNVDSDSNQEAIATDLAKADQGGDGSSDVDMIVCDKCNKKILVWDFPEHADFHFAMDLQSTENQPGIPLGGRGATAPRSSLGVKRKSSESQTKGRPPKRASLGGNSKSTQKLDRFFKKS